MDTHDASPEHIPDRRTVTDWREDKNLQECLFHMLTNGIECDAHFRVGPEREIIQAHKIVIASRSCVFFAMFCGPMAETSEVEIPDVQPCIFTQMIKFLYTDDIIFKCDNAIGLLYLAKKYALQNLEAQCLTFLETSLKENSCMVLEQAHVYDEMRLFHKTLAFVKDNGEKALKSDDFKDLCHDCLDRVIMEDDLNASEPVVFDAVLSWAEAECIRQGRVVNSEEKRAVLGQSLFYIRFPLLDQVFFAKHVSPKAILTDTEKVTIFQHFSCPEIDTTPFKKRQRRKKPLCTGSNQLRVHRFTDRDSFLWDCDGLRDDAIGFSCGSDVCLIGFSLYGPFSIPPGSCIYKITAALIDDIQSSLIPQSQITISMETKREEISYDVYFKDPVHMMKNKRYILTVNIDGPSTFRGIGGRTSVFMADDVWTFFGTIEKSTNGTNTERGQIPTLIYSPET